MDEATCQRIFEPFFTTESVGEGAGMRLAIVQRVVASHRGAVTVTSRPGAGTRFDVHLPLAGRAATQLPPAALAEASCGRG